ncbi:MAG: nucleotide sugar dehydrogenase [Phycisphaeraceae bacterium]|nr:nucleotide sugar dehydrogenase [Phycisphaeraceae bacterium]
MIQTLAEKIDSVSATVGIIGLGYVGLPLSGVFVKAGFEVIGFDVDAKRVEDLSAGRNYLKHLGVDYAAELIRTGRFAATDDFSQLAEPDVVIVCVPTPLGPHLEPDLSYVRSTAESVRKALRPGQLVVLESTTYPSTTRGILLPLLETGGLRCGEDFFVAFSPEREDPGRHDLGTSQIPKLVGGLDEASGRLAADLYRKAFERVVPVRNAEVAESAKLLENIYRAVNIALVNEMKVILQAMDIDVWEVIDAAATKPFGYQAFYPGPGLGGHCIPIDPFYLSWKAREVGQPTRFIELAGQINRLMPDYVIEKTIRALNSVGRAVAGAKVLLLGLAYKPDVDDVRESPAMELIEKLQQLGAEVDYNDPHIPRTHKMRRHDLQMESVDLSGGAIGRYDCVLIATDHSAYDWSQIGQEARLIVDTRGVMRRVPHTKAKVVMA